MNLSQLTDLKSLIVTPGSVFRMTFYPSDGVTPKHQGDTSRTKYFVVLGKDKDHLLVGSLLINTDVNINFIHTIAPYQHCIYPEQYDFLHGKYRYINCYQIKEIPLDRVLSEATYIGQLTEQDLASTIQLTNNSPVNKPATLKKYGVYQMNQSND